MLIYTTDKKSGVSSKRHHKVPSPWCAQQHPHIQQILRKPPIQQKLTIDAPNNKYEQEADPVAYQVIWMPDSGSSTLDHGASSNFPSSNTNPGMKGLAEMGLREESSSLQSKGDYRSSLGDVANSVRVFVGDMASRACSALGTKAYSYVGNIVLSDPNVKNNVIDHEAYHAAHQKLNTMDSDVSASRARDCSTEDGANRFAAIGQMRGGATIDEKSSVPRLSLYSKKTLSGKEFRISDDEKMAVRQDTNTVDKNTFYGSKHFYAEPGLITVSDAKLKRQKSALSLAKEPGITLTVKPGKPAVSGTLTSPRFAGDPRLEAIMKKVKSEYIRWGAKGTAVEKIQQALVDADHPLPKYGVDGVAKDETKAAIKSFQRKVGLTGKGVDGVIGPITLGHLDRAFGGGSRPAIPAKVLHRISATNVNTSTKGLSMKIVDDCGGAAKTIMMGAKPGFSKAAPQGGSNVKGVYKVGSAYVETPVFTTSKQVRDHVMKKVMGKGTAATAMTEYWSKTSAERDVIDKKAEINKYAQVKTGESHSIVRGDSTGWNWHWGAVIMQSGADSVTLENFAGSGDTAWDFQMYATTGSQSFHMEQKQRLQSDKISPEYGYRPITVRIKPA